MQIEEKEQSYIRIVWNLMLWVLQSRLK